MIEICKDIDSSKHVEEKTLGTLKYSIFSVFTDIIILLLAEWYFLLELWSFCACQSASWLWGERRPRAKISRVCPGRKHSWKSELWVRRPLVRSPSGIPTNLFLALVGILLEEERSALILLILQLLSEIDCLFWTDQYLALKLQSGIASYVVWQDALWKDSSNDLSRARVSLSGRGFIVCAGGRGDNRLVALQTLPVTSYL